MSKFSVESLHGSIKLLIKGLESIKKLRLLNCKLIFRCVEGTGERVIA